MGSASSNRLKIATLIVLATIGLLFAPGWAPEAWGTALRFFAVIAGLCVFVYLGLRVVALRAGLGVALVLFLSGLALEVGSFARLYQKEGVLCAVTRATRDRDVVQLSYESRNDLASCVFLSVDVWTAGGFGSFLANDRHGGLVALEQLIGYSYMAIFMAILITVLQQYVQARR